MPLPGPKRPNFFLKYTNKNTKRHALLHTFVKTCGVRNVYTLSTRERGRGGTWGYPPTTPYPTHISNHITYYIPTRLAALFMSYLKTEQVTLAYDLACSLYLLCLFSLVALFVPSHIPTLSHSHLLFIPPTCSFCLFSLLGYYYSYSTSTFIS